MKRVLSLLSISALFTTCSKAPNACFTFYPNNIKAGDIVTFNAYCSKNASYFEWNFGDASADTNTVNRTVSHKYSASGTYIVKLNVKRKDGVTLKKGNPETSLSLKVQ